MRFGSVSRANSVALNTTRAPSNKASATDKALCQHRRLSVRAAFSSNASVQCKSTYDPSPNHQGPHAEPFTPRTHRQQPERARNRKRRRRDFQASIFETPPLTTPELERAKLPILTPFDSILINQDMRIHVCSSSFPADTARVRSFREMVRQLSRTDGQPRRSSLWLELETRCKEIKSARARGPSGTKRKWDGVSEEVFWNPREWEERRRRLGFWDVDDNSDDDADSRENDDGDNGERGEEGDDRDAEGEPDDECDNAYAGGGGDSERSKHSKNEELSVYEDEREQAQDIPQQEQAPLKDQDRETLVSLREQHGKVLAKMGEFVKFYEARPAPRCSCKTDCFANCQ